MARENMRLVSPVERLERKDLKLADATLASPNHANPLLDGEFLEYDANYKGIRAGGATLCWIIWSERGRMDVQALRQVPCLYMGTYEADTLIMDPAGPIALGDPLMVTDVMIAALTKSGLKKHDGGTDLVIGYVTRIPSSNNSKLRFMQTLV